MIGAKLAAAFAPWALVSGLAAYVYADHAKDSAPVTDWLIVKSVVVHPSQEGRSPVMTVEREIRQAFVGSWAATVRKSTEEGFVIACSANGSTDYMLGAVLPKPVTLDWWTFPVKCELSPGVYRLDTTWTVKAEGYPDKHLTVRSNLFEVKPRT